MLQLYFMIHRNSSARALFFFQVAGHGKPKIAERFPRSSIDINLTQTSALKFNDHQKRSLFFISEFNKSIDSFLNFFLFFFFFFFVARLTSDSAESGKNDTNVAILGKTIFATSFLLLIALIPVISSSLFITASRFKCYRYRTCRKFYIFPRLFTKDWEFFETTDSNGTHSMRVNPFQTIRARAIKIR